MMDGKSDTDRVDGICACKPLDPSCVVQIGSIATSTASSSLKKQCLPRPSLAVAGGPAAQEK